MEQSKSKSKALGEAPIPRLLLSLVIPAVFSQLVNALYNIVDRIYIGNIPGEGALALTGVGLCFPILMLISAFSYLFGMGGAPKAAIKMGEGDTEGAEKILGNCAVALVMASIVITAFFLTFGREMLFWFGASSQTIDYAWGYIHIYLMGTIFVQMTLGLNAFITTQGFTTYSMCTILLGAGLNIILDPIFIFVFDMGVQGAATATVLSQAVSSIWVVLFLTGKKTLLKIKVENLRLQWKIIGPCIALGLAPFTMTATESLLNIAFNTSLQTYGGDVAVGAMTIISSIFTLTFLPLQGITQGAQPIISYNFGAGKRKRVIDAFKLTLLICMLFSTTVYLFIQTFPAVFIQLFNSDPTLVTLATSSLKVYTACLFVLGAQLACQQTFVALGQAKVSLFLACLRKLILLIPLIYILPNFFEDKVFAVFLAEPIVDLAATICTVITFMILIPKILKNTPGEAQEANA